MMESFLPYPHTIKAVKEPFLRIEISGTSGNLSVEGCDGVFEGENRNGKVKVKHALPPIYASAKKWLAKAIKKYGVEVLYK